MKVLLQHSGQWLSFKDPVEVLTARTPDGSGATGCLEKIESRGLWAAGFISYEAVGAFNDALKTHELGTLPLMKQRRS